MQRHVIVVEDEEDLAELVALHLTREGFRVSVHLTGDEGLEAIQREPPDLVVLDLMLPGLDGLEICRRIRRDERLADLPILMLTAKGEEVDIVTGLELGADDYVVKPFRPRVLVARVRTLLRRSQEPASPSERHVVGPIALDSGRHEVELDGEPCELTRTEFGILHFLIKKPGRVRSRAEILDAIGDPGVLERTVDVHVASLRKKLGEHGARVETVRGIGYRMRDH